MGDESSRPYFGRSIDQLRASGLPKAWRGGACFVVAGGPSLIGFDYSRLARRRVIAVNLRFRDLPQAQVVYFSDLRFWRWHGDELSQHQGLKITCWPRKQIDHSQVLNLRRHKHRRGVSVDPTMIHVANSSGQAAINVAVLLGANRIGLLGFDMGVGPDGELHSHPEHPVPLRPYALDRMLQYFDHHYATKLETLGVKVINASPDSRITCFEKCDPGDIFRAVSSQRRGAGAGRIGDVVAAQREEAADAPPSTRRYPMPDETSSPAKGEIWRNIDTKDYVRVSKVEKAKVFFQPRKGKTGSYSKAKSLTSAKFTADYHFIKGPKAGK